MCPDSVRTTSPTLPLPFTCPPFRGGKGLGGAVADRNTTQATTTRTKGACLLGNATACPTDKPTLCKNSAIVDVCIANATCPDDLALLDAVKCTCGAKAGAKTTPRVLKASGQGARPQGNSTIPKPPSAACLLGNATACPTDKPTLCKNSASIDVCIANATCPDDLTLLDTVKCTCGTKALAKTAPRVLKASGGARTRGTNNATQDARLPLPRACLPAAGEACPVNRTTTCKNSAGADVCLPDNATCPTDPTLLDAVKCACVPPPCLLGDAIACPLARPTLCQSSAGASVCVADVACPADPTLLDAAVKSCALEGKDRLASGKPDGRSGRGL